MALIPACAGIYKKTLASKPVEIPFSYINNTFMVVPVQVNGGPPLSFVFDTGIGVNLISKDLCRQLGCKVHGQHSGKRMSGQEVKIPLSSVSSLSVVGLELKDVPVGVFDIEALMPGSNISGFLSLEFFKKTPHSVDYVHRVITLENPESLEKIRAEGSRVPVQLDSKDVALGILMPLSLPNGQKVLVEVDTGSQSLILNEKFMKPLGIDPAGSNVRRKNGLDETGHEYSRFFTTIKGSIHPPQSQEVKMINPEVMFQKIIYDGLVGHHFLSRFHVTYDLPQGEMIFRKPKKAAP